MVSPPATPALSAPALAPLGIVSSAALAIAPPTRTTLLVRGEQLDVLEGHAASVSGSLLEAQHRPGAGLIVALQGLGPRGWSTLVRTRTGPRGRFRLSFTARRLGTRQVRLRFAGAGSALPSRRRLGSMSVFRLVGASWYGGGGQLACGGQLSSDTLGVANKTLPCGTLVTLRYGAHSVRVPVIDRGPYVEGREFDLTEATKQALGFGDTGELWSTN